MTLDISKEKENLLKETLENSNPYAPGQPPYSEVSNPCVTQCEKALETAGIITVPIGGKAAKPDVSLTPSGLQRRVFQQVPIKKTEKVGQPVSQWEALWNILSGLAILSQN